MTRRIGKVISYERKDWPAQRLSTRKWQLISRWVVSKRPIWQCGASYDSSSLSPRGLAYTRNGCVLFFQVGIHAVILLAVPVDRHIGSDQDAVTIVYHAFCFDFGGRPVGDSRQSLALVLQRNSQETRVELHASEVQQRWDIPDVYL